MDKKIKYPFSKQLIFAKVMEDAELCKELLERIFEGRKIKGIALKGKASLQSEVSLIAGINSKSVRVDVLFEDETSWFDIEMQVENEHNLPRRSRYYSSVLDVKSLKKGEDYNDLKISYVIFICQFDYFKRGDAVYFFEMCDMKKGLPLDDEAYTIIVNTKCIGEESTTGLTAGLENLFSYINEGKVSAGDRLIKRIHEAVESLQDDEEVEYIMTLEEEYERKMNVAERKNRESLMTLEEEYERKMNAAEKKNRESIMTLEEEYERKMNAAEKKNRESIMTLEEEYERKMNAAERKNRESLMTLEEEYERKMNAAEKKAEENFEQGRIQGTTQGRNEMLKLTEHLLNEQRIDDLKRAVNDSDYRRQLIAELNL